MDPALVVVGGVALTGLFVVDEVNRRREARRTRERLAASWGRPDDTPRDLAATASWHEYLTDTKGSGTIDERTWQDLDLDRVFAFLDRAVSASGRQALYHRLRSTSHAPEALSRFDAKAEVFRLDEALRVQIQRALHELRNPAGYDLWRLAHLPIPNPSRWTRLSPVMAVAMLVIVLSALLMPTLLAAVVLGTMVGLFIRMKIAPDRIPLVAPLGELARLVAVARRVSPMLSAPALLHVKAAIDAALPSLGRLGRLARLVAGDEAEGGELVAAIRGWLNLLFCVEGNALLFSLNELRKRQAGVASVITAVAALDDALSLASVRTGTTGWVRPTFAGADEEVTLLGVTHPLLDAAVPNDVHLGPPDGVLVTGANMSGKSTFLRTIGVTIVLAQSVATTFAASYRAPWLRVRTCLHVEDSLRTHTSYYQAEVEAIVSIVRDQAPGVCLCLFDELFRGTNTVDRIAGATAVLQHLVTAAGDEHLDVPPPRRMVVAATHDLELVSLLSGIYDVCHMADALDGSGLTFDYLVRPGATTSRNAIVLLRLLGAPEPLVVKALATVGTLERRQRDSVLAGGESR